MTKTVRISDEAFEILKKEKSVRLAIDKLLKIKYENSNDVAERIKSFGNEINLLKLEISEIKDTIEKIVQINRLSI